MGNLLQHGGIDLVGDGDRRERFQLLRIGTLPGTARLPPDPATSGCSNFPGWNNHPELIAYGSATAAGKYTFQLPRME